MANVLKWSFWMNFCVMVRWDIRAIITVNRCPSPPRSRWNVCNFSFVSIWHQLANPLIIHSLFCTKARRCLNKFGEIYFKVNSKKSQIAIIGISRPRFGRGTILSERGFRGQSSVFYDVVLSGVVKGGKTQVQVFLKAHLIAQCNVHARYSFNPTCYAWIEALSPTCDLRYARVCSSDHNKKRMRVSSGALCKQHAAYLFVSITEAEQRTNNSCLSVWNSIDKLLALVSSSLIEVSSDYLLTRFPSETSVKRLCFVSFPQKPTRAWSLFWREEPQVRAPENAEASREMFREISRKGKEDEKKLYSKHHLAIYFSSSAALERSGSDWLLNVFFEWINLNK